MSTKENEGKIVPQIGTVCKTPMWLPDCLFMKACTVVTAPRTMVASPHFHFYIFFHLCLLSGKLACSAGRAEVFGSDFS